MKDLSEFLKSDQSYYITNTDLLAIMTDMGTYFTTLSRDHTLLSHLRMQEIIYTHFKTVFGIYCVEMSSMTNSSEFLTITKFLFIGFAEKSISCRTTVWEDHLRKKKSR